MSLRAGRRSSWSGVSEPVSTVTWPPSAAAWVSWSQVLRQVSQPSAATCRITSVSTTRQPGRRLRSGPVIVVLPLPLAPVTTNSGRAGSQDPAPQRGQRSRCARGSASRIVPGPQLMQKTSAGDFTGRLMQAQ
jgi:hypothetical protein